MNKPVIRKLRGFALDPSLSLSSDTATINQVVYKVPWEEPPQLQPGPKGQYVEVIDINEKGKIICPPLKLNDTYLLAQDGLPPGENNYQFHHQMLYAVTMTTIKNFERGLGRLMHWSQKQPKSGRGVNKFLHTENGRYIKTLKLVPHAMNEANAYFSPENNALLFGYFSATPREVNLQMPDSLVYTCLSHDIIAHETAHAIIHGLYYSYTESTNPDTYAFHEAFADIIALFQHFTFPELIRKEIAKTRGDLTNENFLVDLAQQFGTAVGKYGSLRNAIGEIDENTKTWKKKVPTGDEYKNILDPHSRGQILVSAIFDAFTTIYKNRIADLIRIATGGSGVLQQGELHPSLVNRLSEEAASTANQLLKMCIRALDYCPPTDITFGDFLRAIITSDKDFVEEDKDGFRVALIESFRKRGIYPFGIANLSEESLGYRNLEEDEEVKSAVKDLVIFLRDFRKEIIITRDREDIYKLTQDYINGNKEKKITGLYERIIKNPTFYNSKLFSLLTGLVFNKEGRKLGIQASRTFGQGSPFEIQSLHLASRVKTTGVQSNSIIISILQRASLEAYKPKKGAKQFHAFSGKNKKNKFTLTGGCTLIFDLDSLALRYAISKPLIDIKSLQRNIYKINAVRAKQIHDFYESTSGPLL